jgi:hypothetical protein
VSESLVIPGRFNGPLDSGNGGYSAGAFAAFAGGVAEINLRRPVPLDAPLRIDRSDDETIRVLAGDDLVAEVRPTPEFELEVPSPIGAEEARLASRGYRGVTDSPFSSCFVCGLEREDAMGVFAGPVVGRELVASPWTPPEWAADDSGSVRPEIVWAALDCPTYFATYLEHPDPLPPAVLARFTGRLDAPVAVGEEHVVISWPLEVDGRKRQAGVAVLSSAGEVLARALALLIEPRQA